MRRAIVASVRAGCAALLFLMTAKAAFAVPPLANGQGLSCQSCHTTFPGMTSYGMSVMMSNFQNLEWKKQHQALPLAMRMQVQSMLSNKDHPSRTTVQTLSLFAAGFLGRNFTYYLEQPIVDAGQPGKTEQMWLSWNGLLGGANSLQLGKYHIPFPFMPAHGWALSNYLLATQDSGQNTFEPNDSHWGLAFNGMSNEFMYNLAYLAGEDAIQHALDYNRAAGPRTLDLNVSYGGMTKPSQVGLVAMGGVTPLQDGAQHFISDDIFSREGIYYSYQSSKVLVQTMYYHGYDAQPDIGAAPQSLNGYMLEAQRDFGWKNHVLMRYDVASSDRLNRQYVLSFAHHVLPNLKMTSELMMSPGNRPQIGFALDWAGPFQSGERFLWNPPIGAMMVPARPVSAQPPAPATPAPASASAPPAGDANRGAALVQNNGCMGCHGAKFQGGIGPKLVGIERELSAGQIFEFIKHPHAPMPDFGFSDVQISDIVAYLSGLDGGTPSTATTSATPIVRIDPALPIDRATITVVFSGSAPSVVAARAIMHMGAGSHHLDVGMHPTADHHVWQGEVSFAMGGPWTLEITYDGKVMDVPVQVGQ
ncbi:MAG: cytochrome c [Candidatus Baltobacteraceae bacterium]